MELHGDLDLHISDSALAFIKLTLRPPPVNFGHTLQFKQHPHTAEFAPEQERIISLKDSTIPSESESYGAQMEVRGHRRKQCTLVK